MITPELIAQLRTAHAAATPGEWECTESAYPEDTKFSCLAHNTLPALLDALEAAQIEVVRLREENERLLAEIGELNGRINWYSRRVGV